MGREANNLPALKGNMAKMTKKTADNMNKGKKIFTHKADADGVNAKGEREPFEKQRDKIIIPRRISRQSKQGMY